MSNQTKKWINPRAWEPIAAFINDYWWIFAIIIVLGLFLYFTRNLWLPFLGL
jgi:putative exporter of polyketide antibiotics